MKRTIKIILRVLVSIVGTLLLLLIVFALFFFKETKGMNPSKTGAINDSVWCIKDNFVNAYLFKGANSYLLVDAGISKKNFSAQLKKLGISPDAITTLLLTHTDTDHSGAIALFKNASIFMHRNEEQMVNGKNSKIKFLKSSWPYGSYQLLNSYDTLTIEGLKIEILPTPGHTPGSVCYILGNDYLLTGDNLVVKNGKFEHFVKLFNMDTPTQIKSIIQLPAPGNFKYILTAHHGCIVP